MMHQMKKKKGSIKRLLIRTRRVDIMQVRAILAALDTIMDMRANPIFT